ncbi:hypothetical protein HDU76_013582 [Blyttiomyces sp. JEL0837]|nr:hypothetical protein HDU76_013582 [Blyttiomyces sp. JEL0837]
MAGFSLLKSWARVNLVSSAAQQQHSNNNIMGGSQSHELQSNGFFSQINNNNNNTNYNNNNQCMTSDNTANGLCNTQCHLSIPSPVQLPYALPSAVTPPSGSRLFLSVYATGYQNYGCNVTSGSFTLMDADALLYSEKGGVPVGVHYFLKSPDVNGGRPSWTLIDKSTVTVSTLAKLPGANPSTDIALLLNKKTTSSGGYSPDAESAFMRSWPYSSNADSYEGLLKDCVYVVRANTAGGLPNRNTCYQGDTLSVPYTSDYLFYSN